MCACSVVSNSLQPHGLWSTRILCPWNFSGRNTGVGWHFLLEGIFPTQRTNLHWQADSLPLHHLESPFPIILSLYWICYNTFMFWLYWPPGMWDPSSLAGDWTPCIGRWSLNTTGPPGKFLPHLLNQVISTHLSLCVDTFNPSTNPVHLLPPTPRQSPIPYLWGGPRFRAVWRPQAPFLGGEQGVDITGR